MQKTDVPSPSLLPFLELLRALASQLIVLHHFAFYGPLSDVAYPLAPAVIDWLYEYGRMAVQVFFVLGGVLTARSLARGTTPGVTGPARVLWHRYRRVAPPYLAALALAVAANAFARTWMDHSSISAPATAAQLLAHAFFLHDLLGYEALSAGLWYLAIDFQLVVLTVLVLVVAGSLARRFSLDHFVVSQLLFWSLALAALLLFNRSADFDHLAVYFFGSYFAGMVVQWVLAGRLPRALLWLCLSLTLAAGLFDERPRLVVAAATALVIYVAGRSGVWHRWPENRVVASLGRVSYSLFLVHFPISLVVNAVAFRLWPQSTSMAMVGLAAAWVLSLVGAYTFHYGVERRLGGQRTAPEFPSRPG